MISGLKEKIYDRLEQQKSAHEATVIIYNLTELTEELSQSALASLEFILDKGIKVGYGSVCMANPSLNRQTDLVSRKVRSYKQALLSMRINDQVIISVNNKPLREGLLDNQVHYYTVDSLARKIKVIMK